MRASRPEPHTPRLSQVKLVDISSIKTKDRVNL